MTVLENKEVTTRKEHHCHGCGRKYPAGSKLTYSVTVGGGYFGSAYWCPVCVRMMIINSDYQDGYIYQGVRDYDPDTWESLRAEMEANHD